MVKSGSIIVNQGKAAILKSNESYLDRQLGVTQELCVALKEKFLA